MEWNAPMLWWLATGGLVAAELATGTFYLLMLALGCVSGALAAQLKVAEKAVEAYGQPAQKNNTMIVPGNMAEVSALIGTAMTLIKGASRPTATAPR